MAVLVHAVPCVKAPLVVVCLQRRARGAAFQLFPLCPSRKLVEAALEAGARGDAVVVLEAGRARSQPEQQGCASGGTSGASDTKRVQQMPANSSGRASSANLAYCYFLF